MFNKQSYYSSIINKKKNQWKSPAENFLENILQELHYNYIKQYTFPTFRSPTGGHYRFDFCIIDKSKIPYTPLLLIEYQGFAHYTDHPWKEIQNSDKIKKQFCLDNNLPLIEVYAHDLTAVSPDDFTHQLDIRIRTELYLINHWFGEKNF